MIHDRHAATISCFFAKGACFPFFFFLGDPIPQAASPPRRQRKRGKRDSDVVMKDNDPDLEPEPEPEPEPEADEDEKEKEEQELSSSNESQQEQNSADMMDEGEDDDDDVDPFRSGLFGGRTPFGLQSTLRALSGMMSGLSSRLRDILVNLKMKDDPSVQLIALQELSDLLLVSNEDNLAGQFSSDAFVKELVTLMQPSEFGEENPEIMLLACRSLANLMEAIRGSVANVVHGGAVPVLCQKLLDIQFIDLAEQALSVCAFLFFNAFNTSPPVLHRFIFYKLKIVGCGIKNANRVRRWLKSRSISPPLLSEKVALQHA